MRKGGCEYHEVLGLGGGCVSGVSEMGAGQSRTPEASGISRYCASTISVRKLAEKGGKQEESERVGTPGGFDRGERGSLVQAPVRRSPSRKDTQ